MKKNKESLCWRCERALANPDCKCSWSYNFVPVEGWKAESTVLVNIDEKGIEKQEGVKSFRVSKCPLFIQRYEFETIGDVMEEMCRTLGVTRGQIYKRPTKCILDYETKTGKILPVWYKTDIALRLHMNL